MTTVLRLLQRTLLPTFIRATPTHHPPPTVPTAIPLPYNIRSLSQFTNDQDSGPYFSQSDVHFEEGEVTIPDPPTTCCMSGCANCVWIDYAKELAAIYKDGGLAAEKVMKSIEDPSLKIFLSLELREALKN